MGGSYGGGEFPEESDPWVTGGDERMSSGNEALSRHLNAEVVDTLEATCQKPSCSGSSSRFRPLPFLLSSAAAQVKGPVIVSTDVAPGKWKAIRLRNLPKEAVVAVRVRSRGEVMVAFLDTEDYRQFPAVTRPLFSGRVEKQFTLSLKIPAAGDYFVVLDNRLGGESRTVTVTIRAARGKRKDETREKPTVLLPDGNSILLLAPTIMSR